MGASYFNGNAGFDAINASMMDDIGRQGATGAISVPVEARNSAIISADGIFFGLSERDSRDVIKRHGEEISLIMHSAHQFLSKHELRVGADIFATDQGRKLESRDLLTVREKDVLRFLALGFRPDRIAEKMDIQVATVNMHIAKARRRLGASNREQAIAIAINMRQLIV
jgi:DNA-binding CsgD family transcriptional regulator